MIKRKPLVINYTITCDQCGRINDGFDLRAERNIESVMQEYGWRVTSSNRKNRHFCSERCRDIFKEVK